MDSSGRLLSVDPEELIFQIELEKQCFSELKVANDSEHHVAFKVKTTSPKKYCVRPNAGVLQPWGSCMIKVTLQSQQEYPPDMQCKDKFLLQSTKVPPDTNVDEIPPETFSKEGDKVIEECKLRVIYRIANAGQRSLEAETSLGNSKQSSDASSGQVGLYRLKDERDSALYSNQLLRQELEKMKRRRSHDGDGDGDGEGGLSLTFVTFVGVASIIFGVMLNLVFSSPSSEYPFLL